MKKAQTDLIKNIDQLFSCLNNNRGFKLLSDQRDKLDFLIRFINEDTITEVELSTIKPFWHKSISDPLDVSYYIDEIAFLLRHNYNEIKLSNTEKERLRNLIKLINERVMTDEEEQKKLNELYGMQLDTIKRRLEKLKDNKTEKDRREERDKIDEELVELKKELIEVNNRIAALRSKMAIK